MSPNHSNTKIEINQFINFLSLNLVIALFLVCSLNSYAYNGTELCIEDEIISTEFIRKAKSKIPLWQQATVTDNKLYTGKTTSSTPPTNDECNTASPITQTQTVNCNSPTAGTLDCATPSGFSSNCSVSPNPTDVWYSFVATTPNPIITVTGSGDLAFEVLGGNCGDLTLFTQGFFPFVETCVDDNASGTEIVETIGFNVGMTYFIRVFHFNSSVPTGADADFEVCVFGEEDVCGQFNTIGEIVSCDNCTETDGTATGSLGNDNNLSITATDCGPITVVVDYSFDWNRGGNINWIHGVSFDSGPNWSAVQGSVPNGWVFRENGVTGLCNGNSFGSGYFFEGGPNSPSSYSPGLGSCDCTPFVNTNSYSEQSNNDPSDNWGVNCTTNCPSFSLELIYCPPGTGSYTETFSITVSEDGNSGAWCTDGGCTTANDFTISINGACEEDSSFDFDDFCEGDSNGPTNILTPGGTFSLNPNPGGGVSINSTTGVITGATAPQTISVEYTLAGTCGTPSTTIVEVDVLSTPDLDNPGPQTLCTDYNLPPITGTDLTGNEGYYDDSQTNGGSPLTGPITVTTTVWIYDGFGECEDEESFLVTIDIPIEPNTECYETATLNTTTCIWEVSGTQDPEPPTECWETATFNDTTCAWEVSGTQDPEPSTACYETANFNNTTCVWDITGTQDPEPSTECYETATFNDTTCAWEVSGTQDPEPSTECWETANFNNTTCVWNITGTQDPEPSTACYETATFNNTTCAWDLTGTQTPPPSTECWETATFDDTLCDWDVSGTQNPEPSTACYETANFNNTTCVWDITGTQDPEPSTECWETATFNDTTCAWDVSGTQDPEPSIECYETTMFNNTTCVWDIIGTQDPEPNTACYETASFNTTTCAWDVSGTQDPEPPTECWETATFNDTTCTWDISGTQDPEPSTACYETATFNNTTCAWDLTGTQTPPPSTECWETATFDDTLCDWNVSGTQDPEPSIECYETTMFNNTTCVWDIVGTQDPEPSTECWEIATFDNTTCAWGVTGTEPDPSFTLSDFCEGSANSATVTGDTGGTFSLSPNPGDGTVINGATGEISNESGGTTYTIEYTTSGACPISTTQDVAVTEADDASFTLIEFCEADANAPIITGTTGGTFSFNPNPSDGATINSTTGEIADGVAGTTYTVEYTTNGACPDMNTQTVTVLNTDDASFTLTDYCEGAANSATITGTAGGSFAFNPNPGDGATINAGTGTITNGVGGTTYTVEYTTNGSCLSSSTETVTVNPLDVATASITNFCEGTDSPAATVTGVTGGTFSFNPFPVDGATINASTGVISGGTGGTTYSIDYTTTVGACQATIPFQTTAQSNADAGTAEPTPSFCEGTSDLVDLPALITGEDAGGIWNSDTDASINVSNPSQLNITSLTLGTYEFTYTVSAVPPCLGDATTVSITINAAPTISNSTVTDILCNGDNTGAIDLIVLGGNIDFDWIGTGVTDGLSSQEELSAGNYSVIITDTNTNCSITENFTIDEPSEDLVINCNNPTNETALGANDGTVTVVFSGGTPVYSAYYEGAVTSLEGLGTVSSPLSISGLAPDDYTVTLTDMNGCEEICSFTINSVGCDLSLTEVTTDVLCATDLTGEIDLTVIGTPNGAVSYNWTGAGTTNGQEDQTGLAAGNYFVTVSDESNCTATMSIEVMEPSPLVINNTIIGNANCALNNGFMEVIAAGGTGTIQYSLDAGSFSTSNLFENLAPGNHDLIVQDANNCQTAQTINIPDDGTPTITSTNTIDAACGLPTGEIEVFASGGLAPLTFEIDGNGFGPNNSFPGLTVGFHDIIVQDANGCQVSQMVEILDDGAPNIDIVDITNSTCGAATGSITITANGGAAPLMYSITGVGGLQVNNEFDALNAGNYTVLVQDASGCQATELLTIQDNGSPTIDDVAVVNANCGLENGSLTVTATGGVAPLMYSITGVAGLQTDNEFTDLAAANYEVLVEDASGCQTTLVAVVQGSSAPTISEIIIVDASCDLENGSLEIIVSGGTANFMYSINAGVPQASNIFNDLAAGDYNILVTDANDCSVTGIATIDNSPAAVIDDIVLTHTTCGNDNGIIEITASGGANPLLYSIGTGFFPSNIFNDVAAGNYIVEVLDDNGCSTTQMVIIEDSNLPNIDDVVIIPSACMLSIGSIEIIASAGVPPLMYSITGGAPYSTNNIFDNLPADNYDISVIDANDCVSGTTVVLGEVAPVVLACAQDEPATTIGGTEGVGQVNIMGGRAPFTVDWDGGSLDNQAAGNVLIPNLAAGNYNVTVSDANGCEALCDFTINGPGCNLMISDVSTNVTCNGAENGTITVTIDGATEPITYVWDNGGTTANLTGLAPDTYNLEATDAAGCSIVTSIEITEPIVLTLTCAEQIPATLGNSDGVGVVTISGGTAEYTVEWTGGGSLMNQSAGDVEMTGLAADNYTVSVTDANGCIKTCDFTITEPGCALTISEVHTDVSCFGGDNGTLTVTIVGATEPITYVWDNGGTTASLEDLTAGDYVLSATDANACAIGITITIEEPTDLILTCGQVSGATLGNSDGVGTVNISGGTSDYTVEWTGGGILTNQSAGDVEMTGLAAGNYTVSVTDANGCIKTCDFTITEPGCALTISEVHTDVTCFAEDNGSLTVTINGATDPINYNWDNGGTTANLTDLTAGDYVLTATDANGCAIGITITIQEPTAIVLTCQQQTPASNGNSDGVGIVNISGGTSDYLVEWTGGGMAANQTAGDVLMADLLAGNYTVTVTDANGCIETCDFIITELTCAITTANVVEGACDNQGTLADATDDTFSVTLDVSAQNGSGQVLVTNNVNSDQWGPFPYGSIFIDNLPANGTNIILTFEDTNINGCTNTITVSEMPCSDCSLTADAGNDQIISCANSNVPLSGDSNEAGVDYLWTGPISFVDVMTQNTTTDIAGWYYLNVTNTATGCTAIDSVFVDVSADIPTANGTVSNELNCDIEDATISATSNIAGTTFAWTGPAGEPYTGAMITVTTPGIYTLIVTNPTSNCTSPPTGFEVIGNYYQPIAIIQNVDDELNCMTIATGITLDGTGSSIGDTIAYTWTLNDDVVGNSLTQQIFVEGEYIFTVINLMNNCTDVTSVNIEENIAYPIADAGLGAELTCIETTVTLDGSNSDDFENVIYSWTGPVGATINDDMTTMPNVDLAGAYIITVVDTSNMCTNMDTVLVSENTTLPTAIANGGFTIDCVTLDGILNGTGSSVGNNFIYQWSNTAGELAGETDLTLDVNAPDTYTLIVTNSQTGCVNDDSETVDEDETGLPIPEFLATPPTCFEDSNGSIALDTIIGGVAPYMFSLEGQSFTSSSTFGNLTAGIYSILVEDAIGCQGELSLEIPEGKDLSLDLGEDQFIDFGESTQIQAMVSIPLIFLDTIVWDTTGNLSCLDCYTPTVSPFSTTVYSAQVEDEYGCTAEDFVTVFVDRQVNVFVPTAFSPNNDGINDILTIFTGEEVVKINSFIVFDRWGEQVFQFFNFPPNDSTFGWDGLKNGQLMNPQVFAYHIEVELIDGRTEMIKGDFTLVSK